MLSLTSFPGSFFRAPSLSLAALNSSSDAPITAAELCSWTQALDTHQTYITPHFSVPVSVCEVCERWGSGAMMWSKGRGKHKVQEDFYNRFSIIVVEMLEIVISLIISLLPGESVKSPGWEKFDHSSHNNTDEHWHHKLCAAVNHLSVHLTPPTRNISANQTSSYSRSLFLELKCGVHKQVLPLRVGEIRFSFRCRTAVDFI